MIWVDLESTGLDTVQDVILELGIAITDQYGNIRAEKSWLVHDRTPYYKRRISEEDMVPLVWKMHQNSGLLEDLKSERETETVRAASFKAVSFIREDTPDDLIELPPMAGSSVAFDHAFINEQMPGLGECFSYRNIDVSGILEVIKLHDQDLYLEGLELKQTALGSHRVLDDIHDSIMLYQWEIKNLFKG